MTKAEKPRVLVAGVISSPVYHRAKTCVEHLANDGHVVAELKSFCQLDWEEWRTLKAKELGGDAWTKKQPCLAILNGTTLLGDASEFLKWAGNEYHYSDFRVPVLYEAIAEDAFNEYLRSTKHRYAFLDFESDGLPIGRVTVEMYAALCPTTVENFVGLCNGVAGDSPANPRRCYEGSQIHRICKDGWIQGGDIDGGSGTGGASVFNHGEPFADESFAVKHDRRGVIGMSNKGPHTNTSQFYITLQPTPFMDCKYVAFGRLLDGAEVLSQIEEVELSNDRPSRPIRISKCGELKP